MFNVKTVRIIIATKGILFNSFLWIIKALSPKTKGKELEKKTQSALSIEIIKVTILR